MPDNQNTHNPETTQQQNDIVIPIDGMIIIEISEDLTAAYLMVTEPRDGGKFVEKNEILNQISSNDITYGLNISAIDNLLENNIFSKKILIANGYPAVKGTNGKIEYCFDTNSTLAPKRNQYDEVDYKDLGLVTNIVEGTVIANIIKAIPGQDGMDVRGNIIPQPPLTEAKYKVGAGTVLSEDETQILAAANGNLRWQGNCFIINEVLVISGDVDARTGNIDFIGNVIIKGEVRDNFIVKSKKNITVNCGVVNATLIADGDITISMGSINSDIISKGNVKIGFCEGSKIECGGSLSSQAFISCNVFCGGYIYANTGKGVVTGGKHTAMLGIDLNILGSESFVKTYITLGNAAVLNEEKLDIKDRIQELEKHIKKLLQISEILQEHKKKTGNLSPERETMLTTSIRSRFTYQREIKQLNQRINEINKELEDRQDIQAIIRKEIWPGARIRIGSESYQNDQHFKHCAIGFNQNGELGYLPLK